MRIFNLNGKFKKRGVKIYTTTKLAMNVISIELNKWVNVVLGCVLL